MQTLSAALTAALINIDARVTPRTLVDLYEFYESSYVPGVNGFDPADAIQAFAGEEIDWNGNAYRREVISRGDVVRNMNEKTNSVSLTFSNISRYLATLATSQTIEGLFLVIRCVVPTVTDDSIVLFVGRCDKPSDIDKQTFSLNARQDFGNINQSVPPDKFVAEDPNGRLPGDLLYEGFRFNAITGTFATVTKTGGFFGLFKKKKTVYNQWSSFDSTPYGNPVPEVFGRCQMEGVPIVFADRGSFDLGMWVWCKGPILSIGNPAPRTSGYSILNTVNHFGDLGGTGTNTTEDTLQAPGIGVLSLTAYTSQSYTSLPTEVDDAPTMVALIMGRKITVPDSSGVYNTTEWSDNPVHIARFILTHPRFVNIDPLFMEDAVNYLTAQHCDESLIDESNSQVIAIPNPDLPQAGTGFTRFQSTGIISPRYFLFNELGVYGIDPDTQDGPYTGFSDTLFPTSFAIQRLLRKRYTVNCPITDDVRAVDFLYKTIFPAAKLFLRINKKGRYEIRTERPSDNTMIRTAVAVADTAIQVLDVLPWKSGPELLTGRILLGFGLITSEVRTVSSALYSTAGNSVTLSASQTGGVTATASGATLSGGSTTVQASGTVTIGGTPAAGDTVTVNIDGIAIVYTLNVDDTTSTVPAMLAAHINATTKLHRYIEAIWVVGSPTVVTIKSKQGTLNVSSAYLKTHTAPIADPGAAPSLASSAGALTAGDYLVAYSNITAIGRTALSPNASITLAASKQIDVGALALPAGVLSRNWYMSDAPGSEYLKYVANQNGSAFSINALPLPEAAVPPSYNTTGEEVIRVAMSFATNSQDIFPAWLLSTPILLTDTYLPTIPNGHKYVVTTAGTTGTSEPVWPTTAGATVASGTAVFTESGSTVLQQAGLTRANIKKDSFKWPLGSRQSSVNQIKISYRDAKKDFALTPYRVNDRVHQLQVKKTYPLEIDGSAIDNFHQMFRIANWQLAKNREGDWFDSLATGPQGMVLEEGDVICASDDSGGLINEVTRIEEIRISKDHDVTITQARKYSTNMFADDVAADVIPVPTTLRYLQTADSLVEFIDNYPIRDADGLSPGFYIVVSRDLAISGDWRGWKLYADYGDGYVKIASGDVPAMIGTATTTLATPSDPSVWDRTNSLTFTLKYGPPTPFADPFVTVTDAELMANSLRNLFLVGDEYLQAGTVVDNGSQSYTVSNLLRGRFGTDNSQELAHGASERVVYLDGSEQFTPIQVSKLNGAFNYKVVTTNQDVADASPVSFTWTGGNLKPLSPVNLRGTRDTEGSLLIQWTRRSRLSPGLTPGTDVPLGEETEIYDVEILTSGNVLKRTIRVNMGTGQAAILLPQLLPAAVVGNSVGPSGISAFVEVAAAWAKQQVTQSGSWVEGTLIAPNTNIAGLGLATSEYLIGGTGYHVDVTLHSPDATTPGIIVREQGLVVYDSGSLGSLTAARVRVLVSGTEVRFYWDYTGVGAVPFYVSSVIPPLPLIVTASAIGAEAAVENINVGAITTPSTIYSSEQQIKDFGSNQNPIRVRVSQISAVVGRGAYTQADL